MTSKKAQQIIDQEFIDLVQPAHQNGPDYVIPSEECRTWSPNGSTKILFNKDTFDRKPESIITFFRRTVDQFPNHVALTINRNNEKQNWTYLQYWDQVRLAAKGFIKLGLLSFHGVGILGYNSPEWFISHIATIFAGGFGVGIYQTNSPEACYHILNDCDANIVVVENETQLEKILKIRDRLSHLKAIVQFTGTPKHPDVFSWDDVLQIGLSVDDEILERRIKGLAINQCCALIYTSGTTGNPKGVMLSHDNNGSVLSFLPLSHIAALFIDVFLSIYCAATVHFAPSDALKDGLIQALVEVRPTLFAVVPRFFEKIYEKMENIEVNRNFIHRKMLQWARNEIAKYHALGKMKPPRKPILYTIANKLIIMKEKRKLGLDQMIYATTGGAPFPPKVLQYFLEIDIPIPELYGMSECCGAHIISERDNIIAGVVGNASSCPACEIKLNNPDENGCGEIMLRGRNVCMGYLKLKDKSIELIDNENWLYTGDIGSIDEFGSLRITSRIKELVITSAGENIPPLIIEEEIKKNLHVVSNCVVVGDRRKYLTMLITLKTDLDDDTKLPSDQLSAVALKWCKEVGSSMTTVSKIILENDKNIMAAIQSGIDKYNKEKAISTAQRIQKWTILPIDFCTANEEIGPTGKMKRSFILEKYSKEIDKMYS